ncbi:MAG TPA: TAXI family TRAP transporter solute-binding subunit [Stellaceae bacterium]
MEPLPKGANFIRSKTLWEIGLHIAGNPLTPYGGNRDMCIAVGSGGSDSFRPWLRLGTGSAIMAEDVVRGNLEMAFVNPSAMLTQAYRGVGLFKKKLPVRVVASYPSWDRFVITVNPKCGITSLKQMKEKRAPLKISVREDPTHSTHVLIDQLLSVHGFTLKDVESWGGKLVLCGGPGDARRLDPTAKGEIDMIFDEGIKTWLPQSLEAGMVPLDLTEAEFKHLTDLGWRKKSMPAGKFKGLKADHTCIDFSGWPIYCSADLAEKTVYDVCGAIAARDAEMPWEPGDYQGIAQIGRDTEETPIDVPLHPGAERWFREYGQKR